VSDSCPGRGYGPAMGRSSYPASPESERRASERYQVEWAVDCEAEETFLYAEITNISQMGIFVACERPPQVGTLFKLSFQSESGESFSLPGRVQWVNKNSSGGESRNPGMGIVFVDLSSEDRERIVEIIHTIAYVRGISN
jgi:type IV pilus assembly protein PilZ